MTYQSGSVRPECRSFSRFALLAALVFVTSLEAAPQELRPGAEFQVNSYTSNSQRLAAVATAADGDFVMVWQSYGQDGYGPGVFARRFTSAGAALASEFQINTS